jgi:1-deoxy-D-xylulose-5-phosphate synthase
MVTTMTPLAPENELRRPAPDGLLSGVRWPGDLRRLSAGQLAELAAEIRAFLVAAVSRTGGHLGSNLGAVELTLAVHRVFHSPHDTILWDTGHQAYVHKLVTGRRQGFDRLRRRGGMSGYPGRAESPHDVIENSHASVALSYADGLAKARQQRGQDHRRVVVVVGDGALTGGVAWEALNNLGGAPGRRVIVVLNDNGRSYSPTVGGLASHLAVLRQRLAGGAGPTADASVKETVFSGLGLDYIGPVDGHDVAATETALREAAGRDRSVVVHCATEKGRGFRPAEEDRTDHMHGPPPFDPSSGRPRTPLGRTWTGVFGDELAELASRRSDVVAVTAAMPGPVGLTAMARRFPDRVHDVGIAEQHALASAAGLALGGAHPVVCLYATFVNRAFDQLLLDAALHRLPVTLVLDRAGVTGEDGASHHGMWDLGLLSLVPGMRVAAPRDALRLRQLLAEAVDIDGPTAVRFPKGTVGDDVPAVRRLDGLDLLRIGRPGTVLLVAYGSTAQLCLSAAAACDRLGVEVTVVDPRWVLPVAEQLVDLAGQQELVVTVEDGLGRGGAGSALSDALSERGIDVPVRRVGLPSRFLHHGSRSEVLADAGLTVDRITRLIAGPPRLSRPVALLPAALVG